MPAPVVPVYIHPNALAALAFIPPATPLAPAAPPVPVAVFGGEQAAPAPQPEVCSFVLSSAALLVFVGQVFYHHFYVWSYV